MAEVRLFGKTILVLAIPGDKGIEEEEQHKDILRQNAETETADAESPASKAKSELNAPQIANDNHKQSPLDDQQELAAAEPPTSEEEEEGEQNNNGKSKDKSSKKPDKILPCPRCSSLDTKFCYFNNYNVNQPRHFCKNCLRYWTAGGTMRNVPVGAGRRKSKNSSRHFKHITIPDALLHKTRVSPGDEVLIFDASMRKLQHPLSEAKAPSAVNFGDQSKLDSTVPYQHRNAHELSSGLSVTASNANEKGVGGSLNDSMSCPPQVLGFNSSAWLFPCKPSAELSFTSFPLPFYPPSPCWGLYPPSPCWGRGRGSAPMVTPPPPSPATSSAVTGSRSTLGKHSRDGGATLKQGNLDSSDVAEKNDEGRCLWIPKTLRIDNPEEATKSSIWTTIGIKRDKTGEIHRGLFNTFQHNERELVAPHKEEISKILQANPAAMARSLIFQETAD